MNLITLKLFQLGIKDPDSEIEDAGSSSLMRASVAMNDYNKFKAGLPQELHLTLEGDYLVLLRKP